MTDTPDPRIEPEWKPRKYIVGLDRKQEQINGAIFRAEWEARNPESTGETA